MRERGHLQAARSFLLREEVIVLPKRDGSITYNVYNIMVEMLREDIPAEVNRVAFVLHGRVDCEKVFRRVGIDWVEAGIDADKARVHGQVIMAKNASTPVGPFRAVNMTVRAVDGRIYMLHESKDLNDARKLTEDIRKMGAIAALEAVLAAASSALGGTAYAQAALGYDSSLTVPGYIVFGTILMAVSGIAIADAVTASNRDIPDLAARREEIVERLPKEPVLRTRKWKPPEGMLPPIMEWKSPY